MIFLMIFWFMLPAFIFVLFFLLIQKVEHPVAKKINRTVDIVLNWRKEYGRPLPEMLFIGCLIAGLFLASKMIKSRTVWNEGEIHIFWNGATESMYESLIDSCFGETIRTPQTEPVYFVKTHPIDQALKSSPFQFILYLVDAQSDVLPKDLEKKKSSISGINQYKNIWCRNQNVFLMYIDGSKSEIELHNLNRLFDEVKMDMDQEIKAGLFKHHDAKKRKNALLKSFGWTFETLADFELRIDDSDHGFVSLSPKTGNRWINVRWIDRADSTFLNQSQIIEERNAFGKRYFYGTKVEDVHQSGWSHQFLNCPAFTVRGLWGNEERIMGGPFQTTAFYDRVMKRVYLVDYAVHASGMQKMPLLRRADIVARSFRTHRSLLYKSH